MSSCICSSEFLENSSKLWLNLPLTWYLHSCPGGFWDTVFILSSDDPTGQRRPCHGTHTYSPQQNQGNIYNQDKQLLYALADEFSKFDSIIFTEIEWVNDDWLTPTYLMVELRQLHLDLLPLEEMILCLLTHWRNQVKLPRYRICFLERENNIYITLSYQNICSMYSIFVIARNFNIWPTHSYNLSNGPSDIEDITLPGLVSNIYRNACFLSVSLCWFQILISVLQSESSHFYYRW